MLMARYEPLAPPLKTVCATTPAPNMMRTKVPKNSAAASRAVPVSMASPSCARRHFGGPAVHLERQVAGPGEQCAAERIVFTQPEQLVDASEPRRGRARRQRLLALVGRARIRAEPQARDVRVAGARRQRDRAAEAAVGEV